MAQSRVFCRFTLQAVIMYCLFSSVLQVEAEDKIPTSVFGKGSALLESARGVGATELENGVLRRLELRGSSGLTLRVADLRNPAVHRGTSSKDSTDAFKHTEEVQGRLLLPRPATLDEAASGGVVARASGRGTSRRANDAASRRAWEGGKRGIVRHFQLPGKIPSGDSAEHVIMHVFIKALQISDGVAFRGFMFAESMERLWYSLGQTYMCQPYFERPSYPGISLREIVAQKDDVREWGLTTYPEKVYEHDVDEPAPGTNERRRMCAPVPFEGTLTLEDAMRDFELHVSGFDSYALYAPGKVILKALPRPRAPEYAPGVRIAAVLHPFLHPTPQADVNRVLMHFVNYHIRIGFAQVVQYTQITYLRGFYADEEVMAAVRAGHLVLQPWTDMAECTGPSHIKCWQPMLYSHAILDAWGSGTAYLYIADPDEYLVLPNKDAIASVGDLLQWCSDDAAQIKATRFNVYCGAKLCEQGERALWTAPRNGTHPLLAYSLRGTVPIRLGKQIIDPERVATYEVHTGVVFTSDDQEVLRLNPECGYVLHVLNQFKTRSFSEFNTTDTSWQWALQSSL